MSTALAHAARVHSLLSSEALPGETLAEVGRPSSVAVNQTTHHIYVVAFIGSNSQGRAVFNLDPNGKPDPTLPELPTGTLRPFRVDVDNSGGAHNGYIYASDITAGVIQQYDPSGSATAVGITATAIPPNGTAQAGGLPPVVNTGQFSPYAVTVGPSGNVFTYDLSNGAIEEFTPEGVFVKQFDQGGYQDGVSANGIAIGANGDLYLAGHNSIESGLYEFNPAGECVPASCEPIAERGPNTTDHATGVAVDRVTGNVFMTSSPEEGEFSEFDSAGNPLGTTFIPHGTERYRPLGIAVDESSGNLIVAASAEPSSESALQIYGPATVVPDVETETASEVTDHSAAFHGKIGAAEVPGATCAFQYVDDASFRASGFKNAAKAPCEPAGPFSGSAMNAVHAEVSGLQGGTTYHYRLLGSNENGSNPGEDLPFTTLGPSISETEASGVTETSAALSGFVDPRGAETTYAFQYVTQSQFEAGGYAEAASVPVPPASVPSHTVGTGDLEKETGVVKNAVATEGAFLVGQAIEGEGIPAETTIFSVEGSKLTLSNKATETLGSVALTATGRQPVSQAIGGLAPDTVYHFRLTATTGNGPTAGEALGEDRTFSTFPPPSTGLPDGRAYEQASPTEKNGASIQGELHAVQASNDGNRITFVSQAGIPGGDGQQTFASYMASRAANGSGWTTRGMLPPASAGPYANVLGWDEELSRVFDFASAPGGSTKLLARSSADGSVGEVASVEKFTTSTPFTIAGSSADGAVALFEGREGGLIPGDLPGKKNTYAYERETNNLVVAGVMNDGSVPPNGAMPGPYDWVNNNLNNSGGYLTEAEHAISADGRRIFFTAAGTGQLYVRENPLASQSAMNGEECTEAATKACTVRISAPEEGVTDPGAPAAFVGASADGSVVYFLDKGRLTADSTAGAGYDLYRYDLESGELTDLTVDTADRSGAQVEGVLGVSAEGNDAYFVASGVLAEGASKAPTGETNLYAAHGEEVVFIARLATDEVEADNWNPRGRGGGGVTTTHNSRVSADGQVLLFTSFRQLTSYRSHGKRELYLYRTGRGIQCVSCNPTGEAPVGSVSVQAIPRPGYSPSRSFAIMTRNLSANGRRVFFDTPDRLVSADENGVNDVYEWEEKGEGSCQSEAQDGGCLFLISSGASSDPSYFGDADPEGNNVFFFTTSQLVAQDRDQLVDVYDARIGGGIAAQNERPKPPCEGEACLGQGSSGQAAQTPGTSTFAGPGNASAARPPACGRGRARVHGRCVKRHHAKKHAKRHHKQRRAQRAKGGSGR